MNIYTLAEIQCALNNNGCKNWNCEKDAEFPGILQIYDGAGNHKFSMLKTTRDQWRATNREYMTDTHDSIGNAIDDWIKRQNNTATRPEAVKA